MSAHAEKQPAALPQPHTPVPEASAGTHSLTDHRPGTAVQLRLQGLVARSSVVQRAAQGAGVIQLGKKHPSILEQHLETTRRIMEAHEHGRKLNRKLIRKSQYTEAVGEYRTAMALRKKYKNAKMLEGFSAGVGIDQIWENGDEIFIVEAKGPGAKLGWADGINAQQMSDKWVTDRLRFVKNEAMRKRILKAKKAGKMRRIIGYASKKGKSARLEDISHED